MIHAVLHFSGCKAVFSHFYRAVCYYYYYHRYYYYSHSMVTDVQLAIFANMLGVSLFLLVVLYHYVAVNNPKKLE